MHLRLTKKTSVLCCATAVCLCLSACSTANTPANVDSSPEQPTVIEDVKEETSTAVQIDTSADSQTNNSSDATTSTTSEEVKFKLMKNYKSKGNTNPIMTQAFGADPYAMPYGDSVYFYMTADAFEYDSKGEIIENSYSKIRSIHVVGTKDMKNFTDYGEIKVAGSTGAAKWAGNSWAPAACWKNIDGKDKFFLYFANSGGGIGVLTADSPIGPFTDPLGHELVSRKTPNCANVLWLFDPAVLVDDDGTGYLYFGGGVPQDKIDHPMTGRCVKLGDDMISLAGEPQTIDAPFLFEDSGIHKYNNKYYYSYCTNWQVTPEGKKEYGIENAQIVTMESDSPLGPFTFKEIILQNPGKLCGLYGNNHHCVFTFKGDWYITYHTRMLEKAMGIEHGYRATSIDKFTMGADGTIGLITMTNAGPEQLVPVDPFAVNKAVCVASMAGTESVGIDKATATAGSGEFVVRVPETGAYIEIDGVDFGSEEKELVCLINLKAEAGISGKVHVRVDMPFSEDIAVIPFNSTAGEFATVSADLTSKLGGSHILYFVFEGADYEVRSWSFMEK